MFDTRSERDAALAALAHLDEVVEQIARIGAALSDCESWSSAHRTVALRRLDRVTGSLATARSRLLVAEQRAVGAGLGDRDFTATRARATRTGLGEATREVRQAETLEALPTVAAAVTTGRMPVPHLDALARVADGASDAAAEALSRPDVQDTLVRWAGRQSLPEFRTSAAGLIASFDPHALDDSFEAQRAERFLHLTPRPEGTYLKGRLDRLAGAALRLALDGLQQAPDAERTKSQADADALVMLVERATSGAAGVRARRTGPDDLLLPDAEQDAADARVSGAANRPTLSVLIPAETFAEVVGAEQRADRHGSRTWHPVEPATLEDGTPLPMSELGRLLCDSEVGRMVLDAQSQPLDVGRATLLFTAPQRRAIIVRDRACSWNGCDVPAAYCEAHHIRWWDRDLGETSVENGVLLRSHHHHVVHRLDLAITRLSAGSPGPVGQAGRAEQAGGGGRGGPMRAGRMLGPATRYEFRHRDGRPVSTPGDPAPSRDDGAPSGSTGAPPRPGPGQAPMSRCAR